MPHYGLLLSEFQPSHRPLFRFFYLIHRHLLGNVFPSLQQLLHGNRIPNIRIAAVTWIPTVRRVALGQRELRYEHPTFGSPLTSDQGCLVRQAKTSVVPEQVLVT